MKHSLIFVAIVLSLAACSDKPSAPVAAQKAAPAAAAPAYRLAETTRPASIPAMLAPIDSCVIDTINDQTAKESNPVADKSKVKFEGWAANIAAGTTPEAVYIELEGPAPFYLKAHTGIKRLDVASAFNKPSVTEAGWIALADLSALTAGSYKMRIIQVTAAAGLICETKPIMILN